MTLLWRFPWISGLACAIVLVAWLRSFAVTDVFLFVEPEWYVQLTSSRGGLIFRRISSNGPDWESGPRFGWKRQANVHGMYYDGLPTDHEALGLGYFYWTDVKPRNLMGRRGTMFSSFEMWLPYWFPVVVTATLFWFRLSRFRSRLRRARLVAAGMCPECGYDLRGSRNRCPECGTAI
jgi:hypothetical protein